MADPNNLYRAVIDGAAVLFVGSGVGFLSEDRKGRPLPDGKKLCRELGGLIGKDDVPPNLPLVSNHVANKIGRPEFIKFLDERLEVRAVNGKLSTLYNFPWYRIYTTNYDNAIEYSRSGSNLVSSLTIKDSIGNVGEGSIVHLNGSMRSVAATSLDEDLKLTDLSYAIDDLISTDWADQFRVDIRSSRALVFLGYSLSDLDIARLLISSPDITEKTLFFIAPDADELEVDGLLNFGNVIDGGVDALAESLEEVKASYQPTHFSPLTELRELRSPDSNRDVAASRLVYDQLVYGDVPEEEILAGKSPAEGVRFLVGRSQVENAVASIRAGKARDVFIHGEIASGKTCSALDLATQLILSGYQVFWVTKGPNLRRDLERASRLDRDVVLIFDSYGSFIDEIKFYCMARPANHHLILCSRTTSHDLLQDTIENSEGFGPSVECHLESISIRDGADFAALINFAGLWGKFSGLTVSELSSIIRKEFHSSLYLLLLEIVKSKKVQEDLHRLLEPISFNKKASLIFNSVFVVTALGFSFDINQWQSFFRIDSIRSVINRYDEQFRTFMALGVTDVVPRSGLLSSHILKTFSNDSDISECLVRLYTGAVEAAKYDPEMEDLRVELNRFGAIEQIFSDSNPYERIMDYFDRIRSIGNTANISDYWLQCGIASTAYDDLARAETAFVNAYERERRKPVPRLRRIDNYYSRFEMKKAVAERDSEKAFKTFKQAHNRLIQQIFEDKNRHYPFKTSREFTAIAAHHFDKWNMDEKSEFLEMVQDIRKRAIRYRDSKGDASSDVAFLIRETRELLIKLSGDDPAKDVPSLDPSPIPH